MDWRHFFIGFIFFCAWSPVLANETSFRSLISTANSAFRAKDYTGALRSYTEADVALAQSAPNSFLRARLVSNIATTKVYLGDRRGALPIFERSLDLYTAALSATKIPSLKEVEEALICAERVAKMAESFGDLSKAAVIRTRFAAANRVLAQALISKKTDVATPLVKAPIVPPNPDSNGAEKANSPSGKTKPPEAVKEYSDEGLDQGALSRNAYTQASNGNYEGAAETYRTIISHWQPRFMPYPVLCEYAKVLHKLNKTDECIQQLEQQIALWPKDVRAYNFLQSVYEGMGAENRANEVHQQFLDAIGANPSSELTRLSNLAPIPLDHWSADKMPLSYFFDDQIARKVSAGVKFDVISVIAEAFLQWENATGGVVRFQRVFDKQRAAIVCNFTDDPQSLHHDSALGVTMLTGGLEKPYVAVIDFLSSFPVLDGSPRDQFMHVALHEIGHAIRLGHSEKKDDVMYATVGRPVHTMLSANDKSRVNALYLK